MQGLERVEAVAAAMPPAARGQLGRQQVAEPGLDGIAVARPGVEAGPVGHAVVEQGHVAGLQLQRLRRRLEGGVEALGDEGVAGAERAALAVALEADLHRIDAVRGVRRGVDGAVVGAGRRQGHPGGDIVHGEHVVGIVLVPGEAAPGLAGQVHAEHAVLERRVQLVGPHRPTRRRQQPALGDDGPEHRGLAHGVIDRAEPRTVGLGQGGDALVEVLQRRRAGRRREIGQRGHGVLDQARRNQRPVDAQ